MRNLLSILLLKLLKRIDPRLYEELDFNLEHTLYGGEPEDWFSEEQAPETHRVKYLIRGNLAGANVMSCLIRAKARCDNLLQRL